MRLQAAQATNDDGLYLAAMTDLGKTFPNDPSVELTAIDAYILRKEHEKALAAIDRLDKRVGGDPYLKSIKAGVLFDQGKHEEAARFAQSAVDAEPTLRDAHNVRLDIANAQKKYGDMARFLVEYQAVFHERLEGFESEPGYAGFVASAEYKRYEGEASKQ